MAAPAIVGELVERFNAHRETYLSSQYNEAQLREEFLNPFFEALGWDVYNRQGYAEAYKEVIHEDAIKVGGRTKAPDYCFRAGGGQRSLFVEAKKPSVDIGEAAGPAYQLRRYAWSAKLPVSILSDFEHFAVYDCRIRPVRTDKATAARIIFRHYTEYLECWDELFGLFSPENIRRGSLERLVASKKIKKGTAEVDAAFLDEIESWRSELARNIALRNGELFPRDLNFAVQRTVDRIVFLRICEDRGIEPYGTLESLRNAANIYRRLVELFQRADDRYNSGLFHFTPEKGRSEPPDELTLSLTIDDRPLKEIIQALYFPESPYEFSVFPVEILGQVYEQFLGKVIRLTKGHQAKVEEKPEVRKAGGVYYTPGYIVDYIVRHTVGRLLEGGGRKAEGGVGRAEGRGRKDESLAAAGTAASGRRLTPAQASKLRILDPACGSGSFLIGAYQYLLTWHRDWYVSDGPEKHARGRNPKLYRSSAGDWRLTTAEKKRILLNNIYGVDIDPQAVEVTKLSLLLKVLEGESKETVNNQLRLLHERALPDLGGNIKCGNSLIGPDFYQGRQLSLLDDEERYRINVFDWHDKKDGFGHIMAAGRFDAVIGNPPYVSIQTMNESGPEEVEYYNSRYSAAGKGNYDIYVVFVERGLSLLRSHGLLSYILPSKFFATDYGRPLRGLLSRAHALDGVVDFRHGQVFEQATTYTCLLFLSRESRESFQYTLASNPTMIRDGSPPGFPVDATKMSDAPWVFLPAGSQQFIEKVRNSGTPLLNLPAKIFRGSSTGNDDVFMLRATRDGYTTRDGLAVEIEREVLRVPIYATDFGRYRFNPDGAERVIFPYVVSADGYRELQEREFADKFPRAFSYLKSRKGELLKRKQYKSWFSFSAPRNLDGHESAHLMVPLLANKGSYCALPNRMRRYCPMASGGFTISISEAQRLNPLYVLGILNSKVLYWFLERISNVFRGGWITCTKQYVGTLPIRTIELDQGFFRKRHDRMVDLVEAMLGLHKKLATARTEHDKTVLDRQIAATDRQIDQLVYELYGLSDEEIAIVEQAG